MMTSPGACAPVLPGARRASRGAGRKQPPPRQLPPPGPRLCPPAPATTALPQRPRPPRQLVRQRPFAAAAERQALQPERAAVAADAAAPTHPHGSRTSRRARALRACRRTLRSCTERWGGGGAGAWLAGGRGREGTCSSTGMYCSVRTAPHQAVGLPHPVPQCLWFPPCVVCAPVAAIGNDAHDSTWPGLPVRVCGCTQACEAEDPVYVDRASGYKVGWAWGRGAGGHRIAVAAALYCIGLRQQLLR